MFAGHLPELLIVLVLALVVFGPKRLPEIGGSLGKGIREFKKSTSELQDSFHGHEKDTTTAPTTHAVSTVTPAEVRPVSDSQVGSVPPAVASAPEHKVG